MALSEETLSKAVFLTLRLIGNREGQEEKPSVGKQTLLKELFGGKGGVQSLRLVAMNLLKTVSSAYSGEPSRARANIDTYHSFTLVTLVTEIGSFKKCYSR